MATTTSQAEVLSAIKAATANTVMVQCPIYIKRLTATKNGRPSRTIKMALPNPQSTEGRKLYVSIPLFDEVAERDGEYLFRAGRETRDPDERMLVATVIFSPADLKEEEYQGRSFWKLWNATIFGPIAYLFNTTPAKQEEQEEETSQYSPDDDYVDDLS